MSQTVFTHNLALSGSFLLLGQYILCCFNSNFFGLTDQLGLSLWPREQDEPPWSSRCCLLFHSLEIVERAERLNSFQNWWEGLQRHLSLTTFFYTETILLFFRKALHLAWRKSFSVSLNTNLNTASLVEKSLTTAIVQISSASVMLECWQNLSQLTNHRVHQILVYWNDLLLSFIH